MTSEVETAFYASLCRANQVFETALLGSDTAQARHTHGEPSPSSPLLCPQRTAFFLFLRTDIGRTSKAWTETKSLICTGMSLLMESICWYHFFVFLSFNKKICLFHGNELKEKRNTFKILKGVNLSWGFN